MKTSCTSGPVLVKPHASVSLRPSTTSGTPASVAPTTLIVAAPGRSSARWARYQVEGAVSRKCGSLASSGLPERVRAPETTQLLEAPPPIRSSTGSRAACFCAATLAPEGIKGGQLGQRRGSVDVVARQQVLDLCRGETFRGERQARHLVVEIGAQIQRHHLGGDEAVGHAPRLGLVAQQQELRGKPRLEQPGLAADEGVDAPRIGFEALPDLGESAACERSAWP